MAREPGTKLVSFTPMEIDQFGLTEADDISAAVKAMMQPTVSGNVLDVLDHDLREFVQSRAVGLGVTEQEVVSAALRSFMMEVITYKAPEAA